ncbi:MAG: hypothetical protein WCJ30_04685, partial [Deltaproteobacteria bacterium]
TMIETDHASLTPPRRRRALFALAGGTLVATALVAVAPRSGNAVSTRTFVLDSATDLSAGPLDRVAVTSDGQVVLGADIQRAVLEPTAQSVWSLLDLGNGSALAGSGVDGRVYQVTGTRATLYAETGATVVTSLARAEDGTVYAGTFPDEKIFRLRPPQNGHPQTPELLVQLPGTSYVWALAWDRARHVLLAGTGADGKLYSVDAAGHASVVFDSDESHLDAIAIAADGTVYVGAGGGHAVLYAVRAGQARAVARFTGDEVKSIVIAGTDVYVAANEFTEPPEPPRRIGNAAARGPVPGGPVAPRPRAGRGSVYRVNPAGVTERVYNNADSHVTALEWDAAAHEIYAALGVGGRIVAIAADRTSRVAFDVDETQVLALDLTGSAHMFATADTGALYTATTARPTGATWTSRVLDATTVSRWGAVRWRGAGTLTWEARSGNADPPDSTWNSWSAVDGDSVVRAPAARYLQIRARWAGTGVSVLRAVTAYYLPTNQRAVLTDVSAETKSGDPRPQAVKIGWKVDNPDSDALRYRVRFRGDAEQNWRSVLRIGEYVTTTSYDWSIDGLPEGYYRVQIEASDEAVNPEGDAQRDVRVSEPVLVDNTAPRVVVRVVGGVARGEAVDGVSAITRVELAVDSLDWRPMRAVDGVFDEPSESFEAVLPMFGDGGEHVVSVRATDEAGNLGIASAAFRSH